MEFHMDEPNGSTGLGWTFNFQQGVITRTVRGMPDEKSIVKTVPDIDILGLWTPDICKLS